jgi:hypothetical protein
MAVLKVLEIMADSNESWDDATRIGIKKANETVKNIRSAWVQDQSVTIKNGQIDEYRVKLRISFEVK